MIRKFTLQNSELETVNLNDEDLFGHTPDGLGLDIGHEYMGANGNFIPVSDSIGQGQLQMELLFGAISERTYEKYYEFANFLSKSPFVLTYETDAAIMKRDCTLASITKGEIDESGRLQSTITLDFITPWYVEKIIDPNTGGEGFTTGAYGKIFVIYDGSTPDPEQPETITDPTIADFNAIVLSNTIRPYYNIAEEEQIVEGNNVLVFDGAAWRLTQAYQQFRTIYPLAFKSDNSGFSPGDFVELSFYYMFDRSEYPNCDIYIPFHYGIPIKLTIDGNEYDNAFFKNIEGERTEVIMPPNIGIGWHRIRMIYYIDGTDTTLANFADISIFPANLQGFSYFTTPSLKAATMHTGGAQIGYTYDYAYGDYYGETIEEGDFIRVLNNSQYSGASGSPCKIIIGGPATNPEWRVYVGSELVQSDRYMLTVPDGARLEISSYPQDQYAFLVNETGEAANIYEYQDMTKSNFITIPKGASTIRFDGVEGAIQIRIREEALLI